MAKGEMRYSSAGREVVRFDNTPVPRGDYNLVLQEKGLEVRKSLAKGPDAIPYVNARFTAEGTAAKDGQKDRLVFHKFFLSMLPGSDGVVMPERQGGIVEFCRSFGEEAEFGLKSLKMSDGSEVSYFDPEEVMEYLTSKVDEPKKAHVVIEAAKNEDGSAVPGHKGNNKISYWELDASAMTGEAANEDEEDEKPKSKVTPLKKAAGRR